MIRLADAYLYLYLQANQGLCRKRWHAAEGELLRVSRALNKLFDQILQRFRLAIIALCSTSG